MQSTPDAPEPLSTFLERQGHVGGEVSEAILEQAMALLEQVYVHLPAARLSGVDPIEQLHALRRQCPQGGRGFYPELLSIFTRLGDRHTRCILPEPFASRLAFLPLRVGEFLEHGERRLLVLDSETPMLTRGDVVVSWNGVPIREVLARHQARQYGAHPEARHALAVQTLTFRPLNLMTVPDEGSVTLECVSPEGRWRTTRLEWRVASFSWFARHFTARPSMGEGFEARTVDTLRGTLGHLRVFSLQGEPERFLADFVRALEHLPREGLILDLRDCEEGFVQLGERLLQLFTSRRIQPEPFQFRVTPWSQRLVRSCEALSEWEEPMARAAAGGQSFCEGLTLTSFEQANAMGRRYHGPVVLLTSARTYSTAEMFAAGFQDHHIGRVLGTDSRTGGGGASPWPQGLLSRLSRTETFRPQPEAPHFRLAVRRCSRVHERAGVLLEGKGVEADEVHPLTQRDLLHEDADLLERAVRMLKH